MPKPVITFVFRSATQWTASADTLHMSKPVISATQWTALVHITHAQTCDKVRAQSAT